MPDVSGGLVHDSRKLLTLVHVLGVLLMAEGAAGAAVSTRTMYGVLCSTWPSPVVT